MKLSDYTNENALDLLADLLDPVSEIMTDDELRKIVLKKSDTMTIAKYVLKNKQKAVIAILARMNDKTPETYTATLPEMFAQLLDVLNDKTMIDFFASQAQQIKSASSGPVTENITATDET